MERKALALVEGLTPESQEERYKKIELLAYQHWEEATGGRVVDDEITRQFWLAAEQQVDAEGW